jgi:leucyl aminopeptidase
MKLQIKNDVNKDKPLAIIGFSKVEIYHLMTLWNLEPKMVERYSDAWDFTIQPVYHFQDHEQNHFFFYLSDKEYDDKLFLNAIGEFINAANQKQLSALQILFSEPNDMNLLLSLTAKQVFLADYSFDKYKAKKRKPMLQEIQIILPSAFPQSEAIIQESKTIAEAVALARDWRTPR